MVYFICLVLFLLYFFGYAFEEENSDCSLTPSSVIDIQFLPFKNSDKRYFLNIKT